MNEFTYQQSGGAGFNASSLIWFAVILAALFGIVITLKYIIAKKQGHAVFLRNQNFSKLVYNVSHGITGFQFEVWVKELLLSLGIKAETTPRYNDHGIDVIAYYDGKKIGIQCKKYYMKRNTLVVGEPTLRDLYGVMHADGYDKVALITTGNFSREALSWAKGKQGLVLINAQLLERVILNRGLLRELLS
jgi:HJR/Mrr/RecB family endonuclease